MYYPLPQVANDSDETMTASHFAPPDFAPEKVILFQHEMLARTPFIRDILEVVPGMGMIVNRQRQVVAINQRLVQTLHVEDPRQVLGRRIGDLAACVHESEGPSGCGTSSACRFCGIVRGLLECMESRESRDTQALVAVNNGYETLELEAVLSPIQVEGTEFVVVSLKDVSNENRRRHLERVFFHDLLNTASGISGLAHLITDTGFVPDDSEENLNQMLAELSDQLIEEIQHQKTLLAAESGDLVVSNAFFMSGALLKSVLQVLVSHPSAAEKSLVFSSDLEDLGLESDVHLVRRILVNMILNALEATPKGGLVRVGCRAEG
ncbi:MAG: HAMP domain-containing histidine kinase, partial [Candidatus Omnitrophica bacterium]|nr:HAMP domain-containing histidine kinase [Candidatus Omnitrophota bacterium]